MKKLHDISLTVLKLYTGQDFHTRVDTIANLKLQKGIIPREM